MKRFRMGWMHYSSGLRGEWEVHSWLLCHWKGGLSRARSPLSRPPDHACRAWYSLAAVFLGGSARQTYKYFSSLDVTTGMFFSRVTRFKAERRFCIFSPFRPLNGILTACWAFSFERSARMSATALRCFPL